MANLKVEVLKNFAGTLIKDKVPGNCQSFQVESRQKFDCEKHFKTKLELFIRKSKYVAHSCYSSFFLLMSHSLLIKFSVFGSGNRASDETRKMEGPKI